MGVAGPRARLRRGGPLGRRAGRRRWGAVLGAVMLGAALLAACPDSAPRVPPPEEPDLGPSLDLTFSDPVLLTVAADRSRTRYLEDEGYTLTLDGSGLATLVTDTAGNLGVALRTEAGWWVAPADPLADYRIDHVASDSVVWHVRVDGGLVAEFRFVVTTSRVATLEVVLRNGRPEARALEVLFWLRRCGQGRYEDPMARPGGIRATHPVEVDFEQEVVGPGTYLEELADALVVPGPEPERLALSACGAAAAEDVARLADAPEPLDRRAAVLGLRVAVSVPGGGAAAVRALRGVVDVQRAEQMGAELEAAQGESLVALLEAGEARTAQVPVPAGLGRADALVVRSSGVLLQQLIMPAEGRLARNYYVFSREPTWWFARLGENVHESLAMIWLAHFDPEAAMDTHRVFMDRLGYDGYLPYSIGPVVEQTLLGTAAAPLFSYVAWEIARVTGDASFLERAYDVGTQVHEFWQTHRDEDGDGLSEWGGYAVTESLRDLENVIWVNVAPPDEVEAIDLNAMLAKDASVLGEMADALGRPEEAAAWRQISEARAAEINAQMWDEETGFYYHVARDGGGFDYAAPGDLRRMEIAGLLPLWAGIVPPDRLGRLLGHLTDPARFWRPYGVPGLAADDPYYDPAASGCCRWRGPVWVQWQFLLCRGLRAVGRGDLADALTWRVLEGVRAQLSAVHQFRELYNPDDAAAPNVSMPNYVWSALIGLMVQETGDASSH